MAAAGTRMATRVDAMNGVREDAGFVATERGGMFVYLHLPPGPVRQAVVICSPLYAEFLTNYRREVDFARALTEQGHAVARFHYMGTGNSEGDAADPSFPNLVADGLSAARALVEASGAERTAFLGTRLGALVAAALAEQHPGAPLVAWEPITVDRYLRDALMARKMSGVTTQSNTVTDATEPTPERHDVLGHDLPATWSEEFRSDLAAHLGEPRPVLLVQLSPRPDPGPEQQRLQTVLAERGFDVSTHHSPMGDSWWLHTEGHRAASDPMGLGLQWLGDVAGGSA